MPRFAAVLPEGRLLLKNLETGETLTIRAEDGPVSIGTLTWTWGDESSPAPAGAPEEKRSETVVEDAGPRPMKPEEYDALEWNPNALGKDLETGKSFRRRFCRFLFLCGRAFQATIASDRTKRPEYAAPQW